MTDERPLELVVRDLFERARRVRDLDEAIAVSFRKMERALELGRVRRILRARIVEGVELAWSANKRGRWRLVFVDDVGARDVLSVTAEERLEAIASGATMRLAELALELLGHVGPS